VVYLARVHLCQGRPDLALPELETAPAAADSGAVFTPPRVWVFGARRFRDALAVVEEAERVGAANPTTRAQAASRSRSSAARARPSRSARGALDPALKPSGRSAAIALSDGFAAWTLARCGARAEAEEIVRTILSLPPKHHFAAGFATALLGKPGQALELFADSPHWISDSIFLLERETGCFAARPVSGNWSTAQRHRGMELFRQIVGDAMGAQ